MKGLRGIVRLAAMALMGLALAQEWRKPAGKRTWEGVVFGMVPYDFRLPTWDRLRERVWNPEDSRVLTPAIFGVGWTVNFAAIARRLGMGGV